EGWQRIIAHLRERVRIWDCVLTQDRDSLASVIQWDQRYKGCFISGETHQALGTEFPPLPAQGTPHRMSGRKVYPNSPREQGGFEYGDVFGPAIDLLLMALQPELARETTIDLFRDVVRDEVIYKPTPASLYGVILEQFVLAIRDRSVPRRCTEC